MALGAEYSRAVSRSRRATFRGHITPTVVTTDQVLGPVGAVSISHLQGDVGVDYESGPGGGPQERGSVKSTTSPSSPALFLRTRAVRMRLVSSHVGSI